MVNHEGPPQLGVVEEAAGRAPAPRVPVEARTIAPDDAQWAPAVRLRDGLGYAAAIFAAVWAAWGLLSVLAVGLFPVNQPKGVPGLNATAIRPGWHNIFTSGNRADALWYERIGADGYRPDDGSAAFFPLFPSLIRGLTALGLTPFAAGMLIAQLAFLGSLAVLYALTNREFGAANARRATRYLAFFPTAFFLFAPFTESVFLLLVLLVFWYARSGRWWPAAVPALLCGMTRSAGIVMVLALATEAFVQRKNGPLLPKVAAALAPAAGMGLYFAYWAFVRGDGHAPLDAQKNWGRVWTLPHETLTRAIDYAWKYQSYWLLDLVVAGIVALALLAGLRLLPWSYTVYGLASLAMPLCDPFPDRPLMSVPRFVVVLFPAFIALALWVERRRLPNSLVIGGLGGGFVLLGALFVNSYMIF